MPVRLSELVGELEALPQFVPGIESSLDVATTLEELSALTDAIREIARALPGWYRANADELYDSRGVYGAHPAQAIAVQVANLETAVGVLGDAAMRLQGAARKAEALELREEQRVDPADPEGLDEWWVIEQHSYATARRATITAFETSEAAKWHAGRMAEEVDRNTELVVRQVTPEGVGDEVARLRGRGDLDE